MAQTDLFSPMKNTASQAGILLSINQGRCFQNAQEEWTQLSQVELLQQENPLISFYNFVSLLYL